MTALFLIGVAALVLGSDLAYSRVVQHRAERWEAGQSRGPTGVRPDCEAFTLGTGRDAVLMIHGFGSSPAVFHRWAPLLAARGYTCRAMRLPGFGEPLSAAAAVTAGDWHDAMDGEIEQLASTHERVWLLGHSMGGALATVAAIRNADHVKGLVLVAPLCEVARRRSLGVSPEHLFGLHRGLPFSEVFETCFPVDADDPSIRSIEARDRFVPLTVYENMFDVMRSSRSLASSLDLPVLVIAAPEDRVVDFEATRRFASQLRHPDSRFLAVEPARHVIPLDTGWAETGARIADFMSSEGGVR